MSSPDLKVDCPGCGKRVAYSPANPWRPFCSQRCKSGDLGAWANDQYVIRGAPLDDTSSEDSELGDQRGARHAGSSRGSTQ